jgi:hypothetical protein
LRRATTRSSGLHPGSADQPGDGGSRPAIATSAPSGNVGTSESRIQPSNALAIS